MVHAVEETVQKKKTNQSENCKPEDEKQTCKMNRSEANLQETKKNDDQPANCKPEDEQERDISPAHVPGVNNHVCSSNAQDAIDDE